MTFQWPDMLWLLALAPLLAMAYVWLLKRRKKMALRYAQMGAIKQSLTRGAVWRRHIPPALLLIALCLLAVAMARPAAVVTLASRGGTIIMAMDVSGSMRSTDVSPSRIIAAQAAAKSFVDNRASTVRVGLVAFSGEAFLVQAPTTDTAALEEAIANLRPQFSTSIGAAVVTSLQTIFPTAKLDTLLPGFGGDEFTSGPSGGQFAGGTPIGAKLPPSPPPPVPPGSDKSAAIVLMTDGRNTIGPDPVEAARIASNMGVRIFTIGFGTANPSPMSLYGRGMRAMLDEGTLKRMAAITQGQYFHATSSQELAKIYSQITTKLQTESEETEISAFFVAGAVGFLLLSALLSLVWHRRM